MSLAISTSHWLLFERNLVLLAYFAGSASQRMANWLSFDFLPGFNKKKIEPGRLFRILNPVSTKNKLDQVA